MSRMILSQMREQVSDELRNVSISTKIDRWINMAVTELASTFVFPSLHASASVATIASQSYVELATKFLWLKTVEVPARQDKLWPEDEQRLSEAYPDYKTRTGTVTHYYLNGQLSAGLATMRMGLYQVPTGIEVITYSYQSLPSPLVGDTAWSPLPEAWDMLLMQKAITRGYSYEGNTEAKAGSLAEESRLLKTLGRLLYRRTDETVVMGGPSTRRRPPRPQLPSNFPASRW